MKILIIDDEQHPRIVLKNHIQAISQDYYVIEEANGLSSALEKVNIFKPDLVFLDIQLETMTGFDFLDQLNTINFQLVFVTAYNDYAIKAFEYYALHYLLKPVGIQSISEVLKRFKNQVSHTTTTAQQIDKAKYLYLKTMDQGFNIDFCEVLYFEADGAYSNIHFRHRKAIMSSKNIGEYQKLCPDYFYRIHKSILVNMKEISGIDNKNNLVILKNGEGLSISRRRKVEFKKAHSDFF